MLSLMIASSAEDSQLCLTDYRCSKEVELKSDVLLDNVRSVLKEIKAMVCFFNGILLFHVLISHTSIFISRKKLQKISKRSVNLLRMDITELVD